MNINIFNGYQSTVPAVIKFQQMVDIIRGDKQLAELTKRYRITHQREYKSQCYCFSVTCVFQGGKAKKDIIEVTGVGFSDFDHVPKEKLAELCAKLREDSHTLFFHITASGEGLRVLYRYEMKPGMTLEEQMKFYPTAFRHGNQYFSDLLGVEYDEHCCNLGRLMGAAYDPDAFFRPDAEPFSYDWLVARQQEKTLQDNATARLRREVKKIDRLYDDKLAKELEQEKKTYVAGSMNEYVSCLAYKLNAFGFVRQRLDEGRQAYVVCPMIEDSESDLFAVKSYAENAAKGDLNGYTTALLHGKMRAAEKNNVMEQFRKGEIQALICTTVVEVGVDVPNAAVMVIENAERFGLSQLHQLRGRVGRGEFESTCILITDNTGEECVRRMKIMSSTADGFKISEEDLKMRGPGDFFGSAQHGLPPLKIADIAGSTELMKEAQSCADEILAADPELNKAENKSLKMDIMRLFSKDIIG